MFAAPGLFEACATGDVEAVRRTIAADPARIHDAGPCIGSTPLILAAHRGYLDVVAVLVEAAPTSKRANAPATPPPFIGPPRAAMFRCWSACSPPVRAST